MPIPEGMKRRDTDLPEAHVDALDEAAASDKVTARTRIRAMVQAWVEDPTVRERVDVIAVHLAAQGKAHRQNGAQQARDQRALKQRKKDSSSS